MPDLLERLLPKFEVRGEDECWPWTAGKSKGYGRFNMGDGRVVNAHVAVYEVFVGPVPDGCDLDHQCHNDDLSCAGGPQCEHRACCNPDHCEPATPLENFRRGRGKETLRRFAGVFKAAKTHCPQGHPYEGNTYGSGDQGRKCAECHRQQERARKRP